MRPPRKLRHDPEGPGPRIAAAFALVFAVAAGLQIGAGNAFNATLLLILVVYTAGIALRQWHR